MSDAVFSRKSFDAALPEDVFRISACQAGSWDAPDWTQPGLVARTTAWITQRVQAARLGQVLAVEQIRAWEFSCVMRVQTDRRVL